MCGEVYRNVSFKIKSVHIFCRFSVMCIFRREHSLLNIKYAKMPGSIYASGKSMRAARRKEGGPNHPAGLTISCLLSSDIQIRILAPMRCNVSSSYFDIVSQEHVVKLFSLAFRHLNKLSCCRIEFDLCVSAFCADSFCSAEYQITLVGRT